MRPGMTVFENGEGSGVVAPNPSFSARRVFENAFVQRHQPACKPGSVGRRLRGTRTIRGGHSSGTMFAHCLEQPTRTAGLTSPPRCYRFREHPALPSLFGLAPGVVCHAGSVAGAAVRSYRTFSPLLAFAACAAMAQQTLRACRAEAPEGQRRAVRSLWHYPWGCPRRTLSGTVCRWSPDFPPQPPFGDCRRGRPAD